MIILYETLRPRKYELIQVLGTGGYHKLPVTAVRHLSLFTCFYEKWYNPIIMHL